MTHKPTLRSRRWIGGPLLGLALVLGGCGGGSSGAATSDVAPAAADTVPDTAIASPPAFAAYELALTPDDRSEPLKIGNLALPTDDRGEPISFGI